MISPFYASKCVWLLYLAFEQPQSLGDFGTYELNDGIPYYFLSITYTNILHEI